MAERRFLCSGLLSRALQADLDHGSYFMAKDPASY